MTQQRKPADRRQTPRRAPGPVGAGTESRRSRRGWMVVGGVAGVALIAFIVASFSAGGGDGDSGLQETAPVTVTGDPLPQYAEGAADSAVGLALPDLVGVSFDGTPVSITNDGRAKVLLVLAHW